MSDLKQLFSKRLNLFLKEVGKYGRLIFNDHFSIILFVLLGFGALYYQQQLNYLQTLETNQYKLPLITLLAALISLDTSISASTAVSLPSTSVIFT